MVAVTEPRFHRDTRPRTGAVLLDRRIIMRFSNFNIYTRMSNYVLVRNTRTGGVVKLSVQVHDLLARGDVSNISHSLLAQLEGSGILTQDKIDEYQVWGEQLMDARNKRAELFTLHFIPTLQCQLSCGYCIENGINRGRSVKSEILAAGVEWMSTYFSRFREIKRFKLTFFGGEPLLRKDIVLTASDAYQEVARRHGLDFWIEIITNGELLDLDFAKRLVVYPLNRVQITLDGEREMHNTRRPGNNGRDVFGTIIENIRTLLDTELLPFVDVRLSFDPLNADSIIRLLPNLVAFGDPKKIRLTLGFITDTFDGTAGAKFDTTLTRKALVFWARAKELGFEVPVEYISGPLCVATAKHSAVFTPDGGIQKCFATAGRNEFDFGRVSNQPLVYTKDVRYEQWKRMDQCVAEECPVLPVCGGGCPNDAMIAAGGMHGGTNRFCQKRFLVAMNEGLLQIRYG